MQYCINALLKNNNEIMQYYIINNDIALIMHYRALLQMPGKKYRFKKSKIAILFLPNILSFCKLCVHFLRENNFFVL